MDELFEAAGTLRSAYRGVDWASTPLGAASGWSPTLRAAVDLTLHSRFPVTLFWGPEFVMIYNEAYVELIGNKHPAALGAPAAKVFAEIWDVIGPMLDSVRSTRRATWTRDMRLLMDRRGYPEECYFTFSYSAVRGPGGQVEGVIDIATETTAQVLSQRRLIMLVGLSDALSGLEEPTEILDRAVRVLRTDPQDLPDVDILAPDPAGDAGRPPLPAVRSTIFGDGDFVVEMMADLPVMRVRLPGPPPSAETVLVARLSQHLPLDDGYVGFVRLVGATVAQALQRAQTRQAERRVAVLERDLSEQLQRSLLTPPARPPGLEVAVRYLPASERARIGGDWYDSFLQPDGGLTLVIGDVAGHDQQAAAAMAQIRNLLRGVAYAAGKTPAAVLEGLEATMRGLGVDALATAVLARLEQPEEQARDGVRTLWWSNAGHLPPVLVTPDGTATLLRTPPETLLGVRAGVTRGDHRVALTPGCAVVLYTDGLIDRRDAIIDDGLADLTRSLTGRQGSTAEQLCDQLLDRYAATGDDDIALVVLRIPPEPAGLLGQGGGAEAPPADKRNAGNLFSMGGFGPPAEIDSTGAGHVRRESSSLLSREFTADTITELRHAVAARVTAAGLTGEPAEGFVLAVHELTTNAVRHGGGTGHLHLRRQGDMLRCDVVDHGAGGDLPPIRQAAGTAAGGRGLWLAEHLADSLRLDRRADGLTATVTIALP
ncbi:SpoIIE family protein phosphatase [Micromonospora sp. NPDC004540]|uniref:SpoIIE family protein phosphatase n=1 Tax=Micromonospora sp. NPDC004540 TaxID=3154457 RepID=UPI0033BB30A8